MHVRRVSHPFPTLQAVYCTCARCQIDTQAVAARSLPVLPAVMRSDYLFSHTLTAMESRFFIRRDLVKTFPSSFSHSSLTLHFTMWIPACCRQQCTQVSNKYIIVCTFKQLWKKGNNKKQFLTQPKCSKWLDQAEREWVRGKWAR